MYSYANTGGEYAASTCATAITREVHAVARMFVGDSGLCEVIMGSLTTAPVQLVARADALHAARMM